MKHLYLRLFLALPLLFCAFFSQAQVSTNIVGGGNANINDVPWQVLLEINGADGCGGSIIAPNWILTAGHCTDGLVASQIVVYAALNDRTQKATAQRRTVVQIIRHPNYNPSGAIRFDNDIALLRLDSPLTFNASAQPIAYATPGDRAAGLTNVGVNATVSGWGRLAEGGAQPNILQSVQVPIADNAVAAAQYNNLPPPNDRLDVTANMIPAGVAAGGRDACQGDSGGPLVVRDGTGRPVLAGIVSFGLGCARPNFLGIYTRVSNYCAWILQQLAARSTIVGSNINCPADGVTSFTYSIGSQPPNSTVTWTASPATLFTNSSGTGPTFSTFRNGANNGTGTITATFTGNGNCGTASISRSIVVGNPPPTVTTSCPIANNISIRASFPSGMTGTPVCWTVTGGTIKGSTPGQPYCGSLSIIVYTTRASVTYALSYPSCEDVISQFTGGALNCSAVVAYSVYPNPAKNKLVVELPQETVGAGEPGANTSSSTSKSFSAKLYDKLNLEVKSGQTSNGSLAFNVGNVANGVYYLHIDNGGEIIRRQVVIQH